LTAAAAGTPALVDARLAAEVQVLLEGVPLPASRAALVQYASAQDPGAARLLEGLPEGEYDRLDAVGEALMAPPRQPQPPPKLLQPESGEPPGGADYVKPWPESGEVRTSAPRTHPPEQALQKQMKLQQDEQSTQQEG
jgi:hypothetical protein